MGISKRIHALIRILAPFALLAATPQTARYAAPAVGVMLQAGDRAQMIPPDSEEPIPVFRGDLLYLGTRILAGGQPLSFAFTSDRSAYTYTPTYEAFPAPEYQSIVKRAKQYFEVRLDASRPLRQKGDLSQDRKWQFPLALPSEGNLTPVSPGAKADLTQVERALADQRYRNDPVPLLSRAALEERMREFPGALADYRALPETWKQARWLRPKVNALANEVRLGETKALGAPERLFAVVIGIGTYQNLEAVPHAADDASLFGRYLQSRMHADVTMLPDGKARRADIRRAIREVIEQKAGPNDTIYIFISGQGLTDRRSPREGYLMAYDTNPEDKLLTAYPISELADALRRNLHRLKRVFLFADICRAEKYRQNPNVINASVSDRIFAPGEPPAPNISALLASSLKPQASQIGTDLEGGHGVFTWHLVQALQNSGATTTRSLLETISREVKNATHNRQEPMALGNIGLSIPTVRFPAVAQLAFFGSPLPGMLAQTPPPADPAVEKENEGQQILLQYLRGDEVRQQRIDFHHAAELFAAAERPDSPPDLVARRLFCTGRDMLSRTNYDAELALKNLTESLRFDPEAAYTYNAIGILHLRQGNYRRAAWAFRDALRRAPYWGYAHHNLALTYAEAGEYAAAERLWREAIAVAPEYAYLHYGLGMLLERLNRKKDAEAEYRAAMKINPGQPEAYVGLGTLLADKNKNDAAEAMYRKALALDPELVAAWHDLGLLYASDQPKKAIDAWQKAIAFDPDFFPARMRLAEALAGQGDLDGAIEQYRYVISKRPNLTAVQTALRELLRRKSQ